jgi:hypothetical protein
MAMSLKLTGTKVAYLVGAYVLYQLFKCLYRVTLHRLAKFPGPRFAAITYKYEFYYDGIKGGAYTKKIAELHQKFGMPRDLQQPVF